MHGLFGDRDQSVRTPFIPLVIGPIPDTSRSHSRDLSINVNDVYAALRRNITSPRNASILVMSVRDLSTRAEIGKNPA